MAKVTVKTKFVDEHNYERKAMAILKQVHNLRLVGETGVGKSTFVHYLTDKNDWELYEFPLSTDTSRWDLLAQDVLKATKEGTETAQRLGVIVDWLLVPEGRDKSKVQALFLDEFNYAQPNVLTLMNMLTDFREQVYVSELRGAEWLKKYGVDPSNPMLKRSDKHYCIIGMNPAERAGYTGTFTMNIAQLRRFESLQLEYISELTESKFLMDKTGVGYEDSKKFVAMGTQTRTLYRVGILATPLTTGNLENYCKLQSAEKLRMEDISDIMVAMYPQGEQEMVRALWNGEQTAESIMRNQEILG